MNNKKIIIWVLLVIIILLVIIFGFFYSKTPVNAPVPEGSQGVKVGDINSTVTSEVEKTNPFKADVNPFNGYKNPFAN